MTKEGRDEIVYSTQVDVPRLKIENAFTNIDAVVIGIVVKKTNRYIPFTRIKLKDKYYYRVKACNSRNRKEIEEDILSSLSLRRLAEAKNRLKNELKDKCNEYKQRY